MVALDAATGRQKWRFDPHQGRRVLGKMRNRGVTYWSDGGGVEAANAVNSASGAGADASPRTNASSSPCGSISTR